MRKEKNKINPQLRLCQIRHSHQPKRPRRQLDWAICRAYANATRRNEEFTASKHCGGTGLAAGAGGPDLHQLGRNADPASLRPDPSLSFWPPPPGQIRTRSTKHIPAPLNQCHVHGFALKKKKKKKDNQLQTSSRIPRIQRARSFIVWGGMVRSLQQ